MSVARTTTSWTTVWVDAHPVEVLTVTCPSAPTTTAPVLFLHGWGLTPRSYLAALRALARRGHTVIAPTLPGFGRSKPRTPWNQGLSGVTRHVTSTVEALNLTGPVHVIGHSFGAGVALRMTATQPDLVSELTLVCPVGGAGDHGAPPWIPAVLGLVGDMTVGVTLRAVLDFVPSMVRNPVAVTVSGLAARRADLAPDARQVRDAGIPMRLVFADADHVVRPGGLPGVVVEHANIQVPGRHGWLLAKPERFADIVCAPHAAPVTVTVMTPPTAPPTSPSVVGDTLRQ